MALGDSEGKIFLIENNVLQRRLKSNPEEIKIDEKGTAKRAFETVVYAGKIFQWKLTLE